MIMRHTHRDVSVFLSTLLAFRSMPKGMHKRPPEQSGTVLFIAVARWTCKLCVVHFEVNG